LAPVAAGGGAGERREGSGGRRTAACDPGRRPAHRAALQRAHAGGPAPPPVTPDAARPTERPSSARTLRVLLVGLLVWGVPIAAAALLTGADSVFTQQGLFFSGAAVVTFGGAYAVLAYVAQQ